MLLQIEVATAQVNLLAVSARAMFETARHCIANPRSSFLISIPELTTHDRLISF